MSLPPFPTLTSRRLRLREIVGSDVQAVFDTGSDVGTMRWYGSEPFTELAQAQQQIANFAAWRINGTGTRWGIEHNGRLIGTCGLFRWNKMWHNCITGYELAPDCHGHGYMHEALATMFEYGFERMQLHRICAEIHADNTASIKLVKKLGFAFEGVHRETAFWAGRWHDLSCYSLLEQDWRAGTATTTIAATVTALPPTTAI